MKDKWTENVVSYFQFGDAGKCPECGAMVSVKKNRTLYRDTYMFRCTECRSGARYDGTLRFPKSLELEGK